MENLDWKTSPELAKATEEWLLDPDGKFDLSKSFANARCAWRRRVNNSPYGETT